MRHSCKNFCVVWLVAVALLLATPAFAFSVSYTNATTILVPGVDTSGPASPYPSAIQVAGFTGSVLDVDVSLNGLGHTYPSDLHIVLEGPSGQALYLMSDVGGGIPVSGVDVGFDDEAAGPISIFGPIVTGSYRVSQSGTAEIFPAPAPVVGFGGNLALFDGLDPNGTWKLWVLDDQGFDTGELARGWTLTLETDVNPVPEPSAAVLFGLGAFVVGRALRGRSRRPRPDTC